MCRGLAAYSPLVLVVVLNVVPRSLSVTETLAPATTAPEESLTVPTILPISFCADAKPAVRSSTASEKQKLRIRLQEHVVVGVIVFPPRNSIEPEALRQRAIFSAGSAPSLLTGGSPECRYLRIIAISIFYFRITGKSMLNEDPRRAQAATADSARTVALDPVLQSAAVIARLCSPLATNDC